MVERKINLLKYLIYETWYGTLLNFFIKLYSNKIVFFKKNNNLN